jgi:hypothetical protein
VFVRLDVAGNTFRKRSSELGTYEFVIAANSPFVLSVFDPVTVRCGDYVGVSSQSGAETRLQAPVLAPCDPLDGDGDGLPSEAEAVVGTDSTNPDTDDDGTPDGVEIQQGSNPLDGFVVANGIIASTDTPGHAVDVDAADNLIAVADSEGGVALFNVYNGMNPAIVAQVETAGNAIGVAVGPRHVAAACDRAGLSIIDAANPITAGELHVVPAEVFGDRVNAVAIAGDYVFAAGRSEGSGGVQEEKQSKRSNTIGMVDLASGQVVAQYFLLNEHAVDLSVSGNVLYATVGADPGSTPTKGGWYQNYRLLALWIGQNSLTFASSATLPDSSGDESLSRRVFAGGSLAIATQPLTARATPRLTFRIPRP